VLHTRVPAVLEQELKRLATSLRVPVSNVVRTILEDAVDAIDTVGERAEDELREVAAKVRERRDQLRRPRGGASESSSEAGQAPLAGVIGFQALLVAREEFCTLCGRRIGAGARAYLAVREAPGARVLLDERCLPFSAKAVDGEQS
jgi:BMFP domain-containing protein YqiC